MIYEIASYEVPHPIPYQGSKRLLAPAILSFVEAGRFSRLVEPFAGSAAVTLAAARKGVFQRFVIGDVLSPLAEIWKAILEEPNRLADGYRGLWASQQGKARDRYNEIRREFNQNKGPSELLFLLARCVKNSVRFGKNGEFNQSPDNRRLGVRPATEEKEIFAAHHLLKGRCEVHAADFRDTVLRATPKDLVYMDPPYQGVSNGRDSRYFRGVTREEIVEVVRTLNSRKIQFLLSYDGSCGEKAYGAELPESLGLKRVLLDAGRSSQATLGGKKQKTLESLYVSAGLSREIVVPDLIKRSVPAGQSALFD